MSVIEIGRMVPAADGTLLATDIARPGGRGPFPAILVRTCYHRRDAFANASNNSYLRFVERGYAFVIQDVRGKYDSEGRFDPITQEAEDGHATIDWIANQSWSNGRVGLWGRSYLGMVQTPAASRQHPALKAIAPSVAPANMFRDWVRFDGCFALYNMIRWPLLHTTSRTQASAGHFRWQDTWRCRSVDELEAVTGIRVPLLGEYAAHDADDEYWAARNYWLLHDRITVPGFHAGGWFDHISRGQCDAFRRIADLGATDLARQNQFLWIGPYSHMTLGKTPELQRRLGDWDFGTDAFVDIQELEMQFFDRFVREVDGGFDEKAKVRIFLLGANRWISLPDWPPKEARMEMLHLTANRTLSASTPNLDGSESCAFDPLDPVMTHGGAVFWGHAEQLGNCLGPVDQRKILKRPDVFYFRGETIGKPMCVVGEAKLDITVATDAEDMDVIAKLCVEQTDGAIVCLALGQLRCRFRENFTAPKPMRPGEATPLTLRFYPIAYQYPPGSRVGLIVTFSDFPRIEPNPGFVAAPFSGAAPRGARHTVFHGPASRSRLSLPILDL